MKEIINNKLEHISDLKERAMLKNVLEDVFLELYYHSEKMYQDLEKRVFDEMEYIEEKYNVYTSIVPKRDFDPIHEFLYPMQQEDLKVKEYDMDLLQSAFAEKEKTFIFKVFFECDYLIFKEILKQNKRFKGSLRTNKKNYVAYFELEKDESYNAQIEGLYKVFIQNQIPWHTINAPYINKIAKVYITGVEGDLSSKETIEEMVIDFGEYAQYVRYEMIPVWNVQHLSMLGMGFAMPCENKLFYEHKLSLREMGMQHGYLIESNNIDSIRHTKEYLYIICKTEESKKWDITKIVKPKKTSITNKYYELMTNGKKTNFIDKIVQNVEYPIKTKAEILRLLNTLEAANPIELAQVELINANQITEFETYNLNPFIIDEIRECDYTKILLLSFYEKGHTSYLTRDRLSFIVSEIQYYYPEYKCEGKLI